MLGGELITLWGNQGRVRSPIERLYCFEIQRVREAQDQLDIAQLFNISTAAWLSAEAIIVRKGWGAGDRALRGSLANKIGG